MGRDDGYFDDVHWLDDGTEEETSTGTAPARLPWPRWFTLTVAAVTVAGAVAAINHVRTGSPAEPVAAAASTPPRPSRPVPRPSPPATTPPPATSVTITPLGHPLFGATSAWEIVGRGIETLVRIQPATGRIVQTQLPYLNSTGPVYLLTGPEGVIIRPLDNVPGYVVPDGKPARQLPAELNLNGPVLPGPVPGQLWFRPSDDHRPVMALATMAGTRLPGFVEVPPSSSDAIADGAGYLLFSGIGGVYQGRLDGLRRISSGVLQAVGPTGWLVVECDEGYRCQSVRINRADGSRQTFAQGPPSTYLPGVISPDGSVAAVPSFIPNIETVSLSLLSFARGSWQKVPDLSVNQSGYDGGIAFSPDGKWLFAARTDGTVAVVDTHTLAVSTLDVPVPPLTQLVVRPAAAAEDAGAASSAAAAAAARTRTCCRPAVGQ